MISKLPNHLQVDRQATPIGEALIVTDEDGCLRALDWVDHEADMDRLLRRHYGSLRPKSGVAPSGIKSRLRHYFEGDLFALDGVEWRTEGTAFQRAVWTGLTEIPIGTTVSYSAFAAQLGRPAAVRAVGLANGANPISVVVPCHRVVGADGSLTGYGGGIERKRWLLNHERSILHAAHGQWEL